MVQITAWRRPHGKPLSEPMVTSLRTHIYVTRPLHVCVIKRLLSLMWHKTIIFPDDVRNFEIDRKLEYNPGEVITCKADGNPVPIIEWFDSNGTRMYDTRTIDQGLTRSVLLTITEEMEGEHLYTCEASNKGTTTVLSETIAVTVVIKGTYSPLYVNFVGVQMWKDRKSIMDSGHPLALGKYSSRPDRSSWSKLIYVSCTVKPVYNDHLIGFFSAFWSSSRWPRAT